MEGSRRRIRILAIAVLLLLVVFIPILSSGDDICIGDNCPSPDLNLTNAAPVLEPIGPKTVSEQENLVFQVLGTDSNNDPLTYSAVPLPSGAIFNPDTGLFSWTPNYDQTGEYLVNFTVTDIWGSSDSEEVIINVTNTNRYPVITSLVDQNGSEGSPLSFTVGAADPDGDSLTFSASPLPAGASLSSHSGLFIWTPNFDQSGTYQVNFTVTDSVSLSVAKKINLTIANTNRPPTLSSIGSKLVNENTILTLSVEAQDPDNEPLTYEATPLPQGATFDQNTRIFSWKPNYNQNGTYFVNFTVSDLHGASDYEKVNITVMNSNRKPELTRIGNKTIAENSTLYFEVHANDPDEDPLIYDASYSTISPKGANFNPTTGAFLWTPNFYQGGIYFINFSVRDTGGLIDFENISITVTNVNVPPELVLIGNKTTEEGLNLTFKVSAIDPDDDIVRYNLSGLPDRATFNEITGDFAWIPSYSQKGTYFLNFSVTDRMGFKDYENIKIVVSEPVQSHTTSLNYAPVFSPISSLIEDQIPSTPTSISGYETYPISYALSAYDANGDILTYNALSLPPGASFNPSSRVFLWSPEFGCSGVYQATFRVTDQSISDTVTITMNVNPQPMPSVACG
jgi:hypothetical protein